MRHILEGRLGMLGALLCALSLALVACEDEPEEPTGLEVEEREVEREDGQIEEAEVELEREEFEEIDRPADDELVEALRDDEQAADEQAADEQAADEQAADEQAAADEQGEDLAAVFLAPVDYVGVPVSGEATVADVISDRGFWLTDGDNRIFAIVREYDERIHIEEGQRVEVTGTILAPADPTDVAGELEAETKRVAEQQDAMLTASWRDITILEEADDGAVGGGPDEQDED